MSNRVLKGRRALVSGGGSGIGFALANALAAQLSGKGAELILLGRSVPSLESAREKLVGTHSNITITTIRLDLAQRPFDVEIFDELQDIDVLVHSAGLYSSAELIDVDADTLDNLFRVNVSGALELSRALIPGLIRRRGQIVFVGSSVVKQPVRATPGAYTVTKMAAAAMADSLRDSLNSRGVRVLNVHPGKTATPMQSTIYAEQDRMWQPELLLQPDDVAESVVSALCLPDSAELTELSIRPFAKS